MFTIPCSTDDCAGDAAEDRDKCSTCHDRNGYPEGWSRSKDDAWLSYLSCDEITAIPIEGAGCNTHPVTPLPDACPACRDPRSANVPAERGTVNITTKENI